MKYYTSTSEYNRGIDLTRAKIITADSTDDTDKNIREGMRFINGNP